MMAMDLVDQVVAFGRIAPAVYRDYRPVFESGLMEQLMRFLAIGDVPHGSITRVSESTDVPDWRPSACIRLPEGRALSAQQESDLAERLPAEYVSVGQYCLRRLSTILGWQ
jgi:hypothetical protein